MINTLGRLESHSDPLPSLSLVFRFKSLDVGLLTADQKSHTQERRQLSSSLGEDPYLLAFLKHLAPPSDIEAGQPLAEPFQQLLKLCLKFSSTDALAALLPLACFQTPHTGKEGRHLSGGDLSTAGIWSLRFLVAHNNIPCGVESRIKSINGDAPHWLNELHPIPPQRISDILTHLNDWLTSLNVEESHLARYLQSGEMRPSSEHNVDPLSIFLTLNSCPTPSQFKLLVSNTSIARLGRQFPLTPMSTLLLIHNLVTSK